jgi:two-component system cell cycle sensor histidine kinase/response regulator CckA
MSLIRYSESGVPLGETILIIDDDAAILLILQEVLEINDFTIKTFQNFGMALEYYKENINTVNLIILDMQLVETDYHATLPALFSVNPDVKIIAMSGETTLDAISADFRQRIQCLLRKPFSVETLLKEIRRI